MPRRKRAIAVVCALTMLVTGAIGASVAGAAGGNAIINDCEANGQLTHTYTLAQLRHALSVMPASVKQYTNCYDVIQQGLIQARKTGTAGPATSSGGGSFLPTPVIIVIIVLLVGAAAFGVLALMRRRRAGGGPGAGEGPAE